MLLRNSNQFHSRSTSPRMKGLYGWNCSGELDIGTAGSLQTFLSGDLDRFSSGRVLFDLSGLSLIDSRGIAFLSSVCQRVRGAGGSVSVKSEGWVRSVLQVAGVLDSLRLEEGLTDAD